jgi:hypothetical protein
MPSAGARPRASPWAVLFRPLRGGGCSRRARCFGPVGVESRTHDIGIIRKNTENLSRRVLKEPPRAFKDMGTRGPGRVARPERDKEAREDPFASSLLIDQGPAIGKGETLTIACPTPRPNVEEEGSRRRGKAIRLALPTSGPPAIGGEKRGQKNGDKKNGDITNELGSPAGKFFEFIRYVPFFPCPLFPFVSPFSLCPLFPFLFPFFVVYGRTTRSRECETAEPHALLVDDDLSGPRDPDRRTSD